MKTPTCYKMKKKKRHNVRTILKPYQKIIERCQIDNAEIYKCLFYWLGKKLWGLGTDKWLTPMIYLNFWLIPKMVILSCSLTFISCFKINTYQVSIFQILFIFYLWCVTCSWMCWTRPHSTGRSHLSRRCGPREPSASRKIFIIIRYMPINRFQSLITGGYLDHASRSWFLLAMHITFLPEVEK